MPPVRPLERAAGNDARAPPPSFPLRLTKEDPPDPSRLSQSSKQNRRDAMTTDCHTRQLLDNFTAAYPVDRWESEGWFDRHRDLLDINCHWLSFAPVRPSVHFGLAVLYVALCVVGALSNGLVVFIILRWSPFFLSRFHQIRRLPHNTAVIAQRRLCLATRTAQKSIDAVVKVETISR